MCSVETGFLVFLRNTYHMLLVCCIGDPQFLYCGQLFIFWCFLTIYPILCHGGDFISDCNNCDFKSISLEMYN